MVNALSKDQYHHDVAVGSSSRNASEHAGIPLQALRAQLPLAYRHCFSLPADFTVFSMQHISSRKYFPFLRDTLKYATAYDYVFARVFIFASA